MNRYGDRLEPSGYEDDERVGAGPGQAEGEHVDWIWIPGQLFARMQFIAKAYELHVLPRLDFYGRNSLNRDQVESLLDEIEFIGRVVDDAALRPQLERLQDVALKVTRNPVRTALVIEGPSRLSAAIRVTAPTIESMSPIAPFQWIDISAPRAVIREPASDGLEIHVRAMTLPIPDYGHFAKADVITVAHGVEMRHENVLLSGDEARAIARFLDAALKRPRGDRTVSLFDDGMTVRIEGDGHGRWSIECRPVPLPSPTSAWETFPVYSFELGVAALQRAIADLETLSAHLTRLRESHGRS